MKLFYFSFYGACLGGSAVVLANNKEEAEQVLTAKQLQYNVPFPLEDVELIKEMDIPAESVVIDFCDGEC